MQIELNKVCKDIKGKRILDNISLTLNSGNIYGFTGDNGCGKTVLFKTILSVLQCLAFFIKMADIFFIVFLHDKKAAVMQFVRDYLVNKCRKPVKQEKVCGTLNSNA